jgi:polyhydroxybutyrate depolymerase
MKALRIISTMLLALLLAGCGGSTATPTASSAAAPATSSVPTPTTPPTAPPATSAPSATVVDAHIEVGDLTRDYRLVVPPDVSAPEPMPLLLVLHGAGQTMLDAESYGFDVPAMESGAVVVYPRGEKDPLFPDRPGYAWNAGAADTGVDDVAFIKALIERLTAEYAIDSRAIFILGASNGGQMAYRAACALSDRIAALGDISGTLLVDCQPSSPVSVIDVRGMADTTWTPPSGGGEGCLPKECPPLDDTQEAWRQIDGCTGDPTMIQIAPTSVETEWTACQDGTAVAFIRAANADHFMDGVDFDFVSVIWTYLMNHARAAGSTG